MFRNTVGLPLAALVAALLGLSVLGLDLGWVRFPSGGAAARAVDGVIGSGEYDHEYTAKDIGLTVYWTVQGQEIRLAARSPGKGWVAVGWGGEGPIMQGFDIAIGYVDSTGSHVQDNFANDAAGHVADTQLGGKNDLLEAKAAETADGTVMEIRRKLDTGDQYDQPFKPGVMPAILAFDSAGSPSQIRKRVTTWSRRPRRTSSAAASSSRPRSWSPRLRKRPPGSCNVRGSITLTASSRAPSAPASRKASSVAAAEAGPMSVASMTWRKAGRRLVEDRTGAGAAAVDRASGPDR